MWVSARSLSVRPRAQVVRYFAYHNTRNFRLKNYTRVPLQSIFCQPLLTRDIIDTRFLLPDAAIPVMAMNDLE